MEMDWLAADLVELASGYTAEAADHRPASTLTNVLVVFQGGFLHIRHHGADKRIQVVSAPAVRRVVYTES
ncbi:MAG: hypothetical protein HOW97_09030 [Catenulispora sp.]|nr:hypothetical protein [Catenulispora sp.]